MKNVSENDRYFRYMMAAVLVVLSYLWTWWLLIPAVIMLVTGYRRVCHIYQVFGVSTCNIKDKK